MAHSRYIFEKYRSKANRFDCPQCGRPHCFTRYIDTETGEPLDDKVGRCDHIQSCGYDYTPKQFFRDNPWFKDKTRERTYRSFTQRVFQPKLEIRTVEPSLVENMHYLDNMFLYWVRSLFGSQEAIQKSYDDYKLGTFYSGSDYGVVFWQIDIEGTVCDGKIMYYNPDGHRKQFMTWISSELKKSGQWNSTATTRKCFFGEHLLKDRKETTVCLVESEKSAFLCSVLFPQYTWIASCGCGQLKPETARVLRGYNVIVFPDSGEAEKWEKQLIATRNINYRMVLDFESQPPNTDIVDLLISRAVSPQDIGSIINNLNHF